MSTVLERTARIRERFQRLPDWEERYKELVRVGKTMPAYPEEFREEKFKVRGCQSQVWLHPSLVEGRIRLAADSDALLVKGIIGLLLEAYDNGTPAEILAEKGEFLKDVGITEHLSMNRSNGLSSMLKQIQMYAAVFQSMSKGPSA